MTDVYRAGTIEGSEIKTRILSIIDSIRESVEKGNITIFIATIGSPDVDRNELDLQTRSVVDFAFTRETCNYLQEFIDRLATLPEGGPNDDHRN